MKILLRQDDGERRVTVIEVLRDGTRFYFESGALFTCVDAHGNNLLRYVKAMEQALARASTVLLLGTAGGALATQLSRRGVSVTAVDNQAEAFEVARRWFHLPPEVECVHADALEFLRSTGRQWDAVAVDVFNGSDIPKHLLTAETGTLLARVVRPGGTIAWNVADGFQSKTAQRVAKALRLAGLSPLLVPVIEEGLGNTLVVCRREKTTRSVIVSDR
ncbi:MAG TPA: methyltransferase domain-containing protein [Caulobacteraceae bacterium]